jgi:Fe-S-cluster-containing dehydrogenase component
MGVSGILQLRAYFNQKGIVHVTETVCERCQYCAAFIFFEV